jgi:hypothetical protein
MDVFDERPALRIVTRAWPLRGGAENWRREVLDELAKQGIRMADAEISAGR